MNFRMSTRPYAYQETATTVQIPLCEMNFSQSELLEVKCDSL